MTGNTPAFVIALFIVSVMFLLCANDLALGVAYYFLSIFFGGMMLLESLLIYREVKSNDTY